MSERYENHVSYTMNIAVHANVIIIYVEQRHKKILKFSELTKTWKIHLVLSFKEK